MARLLLYPAWPPPPCQPTSPHGLPLALARRAADIWWVSALGTASSLLYVFIALILGLIYSGNHLGSVGGRAGSSTSQKIFGVFSSLGNIAFAFGERMRRDGGLGCASAASVAATTRWGALNPPTPLPANGGDATNWNPCFFATGFAQVLLEIQDTLRQPPDAQKTMKKVGWWWSQRLKAAAAQQACVCLDG